MSSDKPIDEQVAAGFEVLALMSANAAGDVRAGCLTPAKRLELVVTLEELALKLRESLPPSIGRPR